MVDCPTCLKETGESKDFNSDRGMKQHHSMVHDEQLPNTTCENCGNEFYERHKASYCDDCECDFSGENNPNYSGAKETTNCKECGDEFEYYPSDKKGIFCKKCVENTDYYSEYIHGSGKENPGWKGGKSEYECKICGDKVTDYVERVICGKKECRREYMSGSSSPNWLGGPLFDSDSYYYTGDWYKVKQSCLERDNHMCQNCGKTKEDIGREPDVHHIEPVREFENEQDAHYMQNVICLCPTCHNRVEWGDLELGDDVLP